ncbi:hypothetical protein SAMN05421807_101484 [Virgibacillus chiguensis]|uniref:Uncharacterized protein n=1 Tax=Virgibacillus chiguensis TaxID=411959 RepID=A0A1M5MFZ9_9BACI|nr:hypothetical protein SAMN05421807_101484 [Virgibacillus chiguensis]
MIAVAETGLLFYKMINGETIFSVSYVGYVPYPT